MITLRLRAKRALRTRTGLLVLATILGLVNAVALVGWHVINPSDLSWLGGDNASYNLGWAFYRHEPSWTFPLTWTTRLGYPEGVSIALLDSIPLVAILLRPVQLLLPEPFQYLGLYACLCFVLQAYFGLRLCARLFGGHTGFVAMGGVFFVLAPPLTWQLRGHYPHLGHWLIVAALDGYFRETRVTPPIRWLVPLWLVLAIAAGTNAYLAAMCLGVVAAAVVRLRLESRSSWLATALLLAGTFAVLSISLALFGVLVSTVPGTYRAPGYGQLSMNLLAPINPMSFGSAFLPSLPLTNTGQWEGYNYLGVGMIGLLVLALCRQPSSVLWLRERHLLPLVGLTLLFTAAAVSSTITLGSFTLVSVALPPPVLSLAESLRISGRLFWPTYYLLVTAGLALTFHTSLPRHRSFVLLIALALQVIDLTPLRANVRAVADQHDVDPLQSPVWKQLGTHYENLIVLPAFQCEPDLAPGGHPSQAIFGKLASAQRMRTNNYYAARYSERDRYVHCVEFPRAVLSGTLDANSAYVVSDDVRAVLELLPITSHRCDVVDRFNLCVPASARDAVFSRRVRHATPYRLGERIDFGASGNAREYQVYGWASTPADGAWTVGPIAELALDVLARDQPSAYVMSVDATPFVTRRHHRLDVEVLVNGGRLDVWTFRFGRADATRQVVVPAHEAVAHRPLRIEFRALNPQAPAYLGEGYDVRFLGLYIRGLVLRSQH